MLQILILGIILLELFVICCPSSPISLLYNIIVRFDLSYTIVFAEILWLKIFLVDNIVLSSLIHTGSLWLWNSHKMAWKPINGIWRRKDSESLLAICVLRNLQLSGHHWIQTHSRNNILIIANGENRWIWTDKTLPICVHAHIQFTFVEISSIILIHSHVFTANESSSEIMFN